MGGVLIFNKIIYATIICAILCVDWSIQDKAHIHVPPSVAVLVREKSEMCSKETGVPAGMMKQMITVGPIPDDEATKKYLYCVTYNSGFVEKDGHFNVEKMADLQTMNGTKEDFINTMKNCNKITLENRYDTAHAMGLCIHKDYIYTV